MAAEFLSDEQARRYGAFVAGHAPEELERFFFLNAAVLEVGDRAGFIRRLCRFLPVRVAWRVGGKEDLYLAEQLPDGEGPPPGSEPSGAPSG